MLVNEIHTLKLVSRNAEATRQLGTNLGSALRVGDVICLQGELGAGKTTFVQGLAQGWGSLDSVSSPTFVLVNVYRHSNENNLFHMDAYRLDSTNEAEELDLDSMLAEGALIIEWPERMSGLIPSERLWVSFETLGENEREMKFTASGKRYEDLLELIRGDR
ncbi:MAG: tRNA (adenosine(37)-N6)-threonylcarbamoyltransferase complex ATPase subunit type 1 TsaE [Anaerolineales bacterium]|nr:tRNA (adenosine(37)-N6)-threonylcarbamoyltransferase complex ATPase subunit type 1 TsaE [Anaerolineales bacterium]